MAAAVVDVNTVVEAPWHERLDELDEAARSRDATFWVTAHASRLGTPADEVVRRACDGLSGLEPISVVLPPTGSPGALNTLREIAEGQTAQVARLCPATHGYPLLDWVLSPIPELCERRELGLLIDYDSQRPPWGEVVAFARRFPTVPMVVLAEALDRELSAPAALDATANLVLQLTPECERAAALISTFGSSRFVSGGGHGNAPPALDGLGDDDRAAVLAGTAQLLAAGTYARTFL
jgi:hypothetical protein